VQGKVVRRPRTRTIESEKEWDMKRGRRNIALVLVLALCIAALAGCTTTPPAPPAPTKTFADTFTYAQGADPRGLDPALVDDGESSKIIVNIYEGLLKYADDSTKVEPSLAESWEISPDGTDLHVQAEDRRQVPRRHGLQR
jgi:peptide/nickel transport system substrate-binding protein